MRVKEEGERRREEERGVRRREERDRKRRKLGKAYQEPRAPSTLVYRSYQRHAPVLRKV